MLCNILYDLELSEKMLIVILCLDVVLLSSHNLRVILDDVLLFCSVSLLQVGFYKRDFLFLDCLLATAFEHSLPRFEVAILRTTFCLVSICKPLWHGYS